MEEKKIIDSSETEPRLSSAEIAEALGASEYFPIDSVEDALKLYHKRSKGETKMIDKFVGEYRWLSNFHPCKVLLDAVEYESTEHAYQAAKTLDTFERFRIRDAETPGKAKKLGRRLKVRSDWESVKLQVMEMLLRQKFAQPELKQLLIDTGDRELIEGNHWHDLFWGVDQTTREGQNHLGKILMKIRDEIRR